MTTENGKMLDETPEVLPLSSTFTPKTLAIASLGLAALLLALILLITQKRSKSRGNSFLLVGPSDAGKTSILTQLAYNQNMPTQISMQINSSIVSISPKKTIRVVDIPGHPRLRNQILEHLVDAKVVGFVVDASTVSRNGPAVAEHLHLVLHALTSLPPSQSQPSLLIIVHKADLLKATTSTQSNASALAINRAKTILERELEKRRISQSGGVNVEGLGEEGERSDMGGLECGEKEGSSFKFDVWEGGEISFLGTSIATISSSSDGEKGPSDGGLDALRSWLEQNI